MLKNLIQKHENENNFIKLFYVDNFLIGKYRLFNNSLFY